MGYIVPAILMILGVALFVSAPLYADGEKREKHPESDTDRKRWEHERELAIYGLRELEFDREMNKISQEDYEVIRARLEQKALRALAALEQLKQKTEKRERPNAVYFPQRVINQNETEPIEGQKTDKFEMTGDADETQIPDGPVDASDDVFILAPELAEAREPRSERQTRHLPTRFESNRSRNYLDYTYCPSCLSKVVAWSKFCAHCGTQITVE